ncbi:MAG: hypothetical protein IPG55_15660 [Saprospiraceae bacterium]|nr:hypothetical protein [Candidatus Defluviibacterium haderslevense]MBK7242451.1 hypothetical protein [Candidatus Defluviibacterium haderslevense]
MHQDKLGYAACLVTNEGVPDASVGTSQRDRCVDDLVFNKTRISHSFNCIKTDSIKIETKWYNNQNHISNCYTPTSIRILKV